ncbi:MAG: EAL domain-containing protein [Cyanobacteria bacterium P01_G01_bin.54]
MNSQSSNVPPYPQQNPDTSPVATEIHAEISHELRTPLTSIRGALGLLLSGKIAPETSQGQNLLQIAADNTDRLLRLTTTLEEDRQTVGNLLSNAALERLRLENDLFNAWKQRDFVVFYQPIVSTQEQQIRGFETLIRWQHPRQGLISPAIFIPIAEQTHLIHDMGLWIFEQACAQLQVWQQQFPGEVPLTVSVNLSPLQLLYPNLADEFLARFRQYDLAPESLSVEITESTVIENPLAIATIQALKTAGLKIYLDDFGTGYSCLARLHQFPVDVLKIDRFFVCQQQWDMIQGILQLALSLGLDVVTEGVETDEDVAQMKRLNCPFFQGFWFSRPLPQEAATQLLAT